MGKRHTGRTLAMQALYQADLLKTDDIERIVNDHLKESKYTEDTVSWAIELAENTWANLSKIDPIIKKLSIDWDFERINPIDKSLLRIAFYEIICTDIDARIALNESIEIAKRYSTDESPKFLNGILGAYVEGRCSLD